METDSSEVEEQQVPTQENVVAMQAQLLAVQQAAIAALQAQAQAALLAAAPQQRSAAAASPQESPRPSPGASPAAQSRSLGMQQSPAAGGANATGRPASPGGRGAPRAPQARLSDLADYDGASGAKLDEWLEDLERKADFFEMGTAEAVKFGLVHLRGAANSWWKSLDADERAAASASVEALAAALKTRFQPITAKRAARDQLLRLQQGSRPVDAYIAEFNQLRAKVTSMAEEDASALFIRGLRKEIADKIEEDDWEAMPLAKLVAKAARIGNRAGGQPAARANVNQMEMGEDAASAPSLSQQVTQLQVALNALAAQQGSSGLGAKTQTNRGYASERGRGGTRGGRGGGRFGGAPRPINIPGVPAAVVEQRRAAGLCFRCGGEHRVMECPNPISSQPLN